MASFGDSVVIDFEAVGLGSVESEIKGLISLIRELNSVHGEIDVKFKSGNAGQVLSSLGEAVESTTMLMTGSVDPNKGVLGYYNQMISKTPRVVDRIQEMLNVEGRVGSGEFDDVIGTVIKDVPLGRDENGNMKYGPMSPEAQVITLDNLAMDLENRISSKQITSEEGIRKWQRQFDKAAKAVRSFSELDDLSRYEIPGEYLTRFANNIRYSDGGRSGFPSGMEQIIANLNDVSNTLTGGDIGEITNPAMIAKMVQEMTKGEMALVNDKVYGGKYVGAAVFKEIMSNYVDAEGNEGYNHEDYHKVVEQAQKLNTTFKDIKRNVKVEPSDIGGSDYIKNMKSAEAATRKVQREVNKNLEKEYSEEMYNQTHMTKYRRDLTPTEKRDASMIAKVREYSEFNRDRGLDRAIESVSPSSKAYYAPITTGVPHSQYGIDRRQERLLEEYRDSQNPVKDYYNNIANPEKSVSIMSLFEAGNGPTQAGKVKTIIDQGANTLMTKLESQIKTLFELNPSYFKDDGKTLNEVMETGRQKFKEGILEGYELDLDDLDSLDDIDLNKLTNELIKDIADIEKDLGKQLESEIKKAQETKIGDYFDTMVVGENVDFTEEQRKYEQQMAMQKKIQMNMDAMKYNDTASTWKSMRRESMDPETGDLTTTFEQFDHLKNGFSELANIHLQPLNVVTVDSLTLLEQFNTALAQRNALLNEGNTGVSYFDKGIMEGTPDVSSLERMSLEGQRLNSVLASIKTTLPFDAMAKDAQGVVMAMGNTDQAIETIEGHLSQLQNVDLSKLPKSMTQGFTDSEKVLQNMLKVAQEIKTVESSGKVVGNYSLISQLPTENINKTTQAQNEHTNAVKQSQSAHEVLGGVMMDIWNNPLYNSIQQATEKVKAYSLSLTAMKNMGDIFEMPIAGMEQLMKDVNVTPETGFNFLAKVQSMTNLTGESLETAGKSSLMFSHYLTMLGRNETQMGKELADVWEIFSNQEISQSSTQVLKNMGLGKIRDDLLIAAGGTTQGEYKMSDIAKEAGLADKLVPHAGVRDLDTFATILDKVGQKANKVNLQNPTWQMERFTNALYINVSEITSKLLGGLAPAFDWLYHALDSPIGQGLLYFLTMAAGALMAFTTAISTVYGISLFVGMIGKAGTALRSLSVSLKEFQAVKESSGLFGALKTGTKSLFGIESASKTAETTGETVKSVTSTAETVAPDVLNPKYIKKVKVADSLADLDAEGTVKALGSLKRLEAIQGMKTNMVRLITGAATAIVAIIVAIPVLLVAMGAIALIGMAYKAVEPQFKSGLEGLMGVVEGLALMAPIFIAMGVLGYLGLSSAGTIIGAILIGAGITMIAIGAAWVVMEEGLYAIAGIGSSFMGVEEQFRSGVEALKGIIEGLSLMATAMGSAGVVAWDVMWYEWDAFWTGLAGGKAPDLAALDIITNFAVLFPKINALKIDVNEANQANQKLGAIVTLLTTFDTMGKTISSVQDSIKNITSIKTVDSSARGGATINIGGDTLSGMVGFVQEIALFITATMSISKTLAESVKSFKLSDDDVPFDTNAKLISTKMDFIKTMFTSLMEIAGSTKDFDFEQFAKLFGERVLGWSGMKDYGTGTSIGLVISGIVNVAKTMTEELKNIGGAEIGDWSTDTGSFSKAKEITAKLGFVKDMFTGFMEIWNSVSGLAKDGDSNFENFAKLFGDRQIGGKKVTASTAGKQNSMFLFIHDIVTQAQNMATELNSNFTALDSTGSDGSTGFNAEKAKLLTAKLDFVKSAISTFSSIWTDSGTGLQGIQNDWDKFSNLFKDNFNSANTVNYGSHFGMFISDIAKSAKAIFDEFAEGGSLANMPSGDTAGKEIKQKLELVKAAITTITSIWTDSGTGLSSLAKDSTNLNKLFETNSYDNSGENVDTSKKISGFESFVNNIVKAYKSISTAMTKFSEDPSLATTGADGVTQISPKLANLKAVINAITEIFTGSGGLNDIANNNVNIGALFTKKTSGSDSGKDNFNIWVSSLISAYTSLDTALNAEGVTEQGMTSLKAKVTTLKDISLEMSAALTDMAGIDNSGLSGLLKGGDKHDTDLMTTGITSLITNFKKLNTEFGSVDLDTTKLQSNLTAISSAVDKGLSVSVSVETKNAIYKTVFDAVDGKIGEVATAIAAKTYSFTPKISITPTLTWNQGASTSKTYTLTMDEGHDDGSDGPPTPPKPIYTPQTKTTYNTSTNNNVVTNNFKVIENNKSGDAVKQIKEYFMNINQRPI
jgi:hypothetical protein